MLFIMISSGLALVPQDVELLGRRDLDHRRAPDGDHAPEPAHVPAAEPGLAPTV